MLELTVKGMTCAGCASSIESVLQGMCHHASIDVIGGRVRVFGLKVPTDVVCKTIRGAGFEVSLDNVETGNIEHRLLWLTLTLGTAVILTRSWPWLELTLCITLILAHRSVFFKAWRHPRSMFALMAISTSAGLAHDLYNVKSPPEFAMGIATLFMAHAVGKAIESAAKQHAHRHIDTLRGLQPSAVHFLNGEVIEDKDLSNVAKGDTILVRKGELVPVDGVILAGYDIHLDESMVSGELAPIGKRPGESVWAGTRNTSAGEFTLTVTQTGRATVLAAIIDACLGYGCEDVKTPSWVDRITAIFVPAVIAVAFASFLVWTLLIDWQVGLKHAVATLSVACPCTLALAAPIAGMVGRGLGARQGILIKSHAIEKGVRHVVFDKTGTLTHGHPLVTGCTVNEQRYLAMIRAVEVHSRHPVAQAIVAFIKTDCMLQASSVEEVSMGIDGVVEGRSVNLTGIDGVVYARIDGEDVGHFTISNGVVRRDSAEVVKAFLGCGYNVILMTGDGRENAMKVAKEVGIANVHWQCTPMGKVQLIRQLQSTGPVLLIGDGMNDAAGMRQADLSIAMPSSADLTANAASIVLLRSGLSNRSSKDGLWDAYVAVDLLQKTQRCIRQCLICSFTYNMLAIPLASGLLSHVYHGSHSMHAWCGVAMAASSVGVVLLALSLAFTYKAPGRVSYTADDIPLNSIHDTASNCGKYALIPPV